MIIGQRIGEKMKLIQGQYNTANAKIRIMPDCHSGKGCVIGTTMTITDKIVPNLVGVDIGCGKKLFRPRKSKNENQR